MARDNRDLLRNECVSGALPYGKWSSVAREENDSWSSVAREENDSWSLWCSPGMHSTKFAWKQ